MQVKLSVRRSPHETLPGVVGTARVGRRTSALLARLRPGDVAVIDHPDLDARLAQALVDAGVVAVINAVPMISGRYANLGPEILVRAGIVVVDRVGPDAFAAIRADRPVRVDEGSVHAGDELVAMGRMVDLPVVLADMEQARRGLLVQLESFSHNASEFLRREQDLLLTGGGLPELGTELHERPAVVVVRHAGAADLGSIRSFVRAQRPAVVAVGRAADDVLAGGHPADVVILAEGDDVPGVDALRAATDVVLVVSRGGRGEQQDAIERLGITPTVVESSAQPEDLALVLLDAAGSSLIVGVGLAASLEEFLDQQQAGLASHFLTRLKVSGRLVDAATVARLHSSGVRGRQVVLWILALLVIAVLVVGVTPVGQDALHQLGDRVSDLRDRL